jgi:cAMP-dependent protein kinase regulator
VNSINYLETKTFIDSVPLLQNLTPSQREAMVSALTTHSFKNGQRIVNEGDPGDLFYLIKEGTVVCSKRGSEIRRLGRGDFFGEIALLYNSPRTATVTALGEVKCVSLGRD